MINILDLGEPFGLPCDDIFAPQIRAGVVSCASVAATRKVTPSVLLKDVHLLILGGGEDISPSLYACTNVASHAPDSPSQRDQFEAAMFVEAVKQGIPILGVCRGAQLVCAMSGGSLIQHVDNHAGGSHSVVFKPDILEEDKHVYLPMTSAHHQMMHPEGTHYELLAWTPKRSKVYIHDIDPFSPLTVDPEIVYFRDSHALGVQGHPEWMDPDCDTVKAVRKLCRDFLHVNIQEV